MQQLIDVRVLAFSNQNENLLEVLAISVAQVGVLASAEVPSHVEKLFTGASDKNGSFWFLAGPPLISTLTKSLKLFSVKRNIISQILPVACHIYAVLQPALPVPLRTFSVTINLNA